MDVVKPKKFGNLGLAFYRELSHANPSHAFAEARIRGALWSNSSRHIASIDHAHACFQLAVQNYKSRVDTATSVADEFAEEFPPEDLRAYHPRDAEESQYSRHYSLQNPLLGYEMEEALASLLNWAYVLCERISKFTINAQQANPELWPECVDLVRSSEVIQALLATYGHDSSELTQLYLARGKAVHDITWSVALVGPPWTPQFSTSRFWDDWIRLHGEFLNHDEVWNGSLALVRFLNWWLAEQEHRLGTDPRAHDQT